VTAGYGVQDVVFDVSLQVAPGEVVALIGPNGSGKTTLLRAIVGVIQPRSGHILFKGKSIAGLQTEHIVRKGLGWVPQEENIFPTMTVAENLQLGAYLLKGDLQERLEEVSVAFPILKERMNETAGGLSGGQRQMLAVARGMMMRPELLLLDEPTAGLAPNMVQIMLEKIHEVTERLGRAVLLVTQTIDALHLCQRGYLVSAGEIKYTDTTERFLANAEVNKLYFGGSQHDSAQVE
jgi:branched-chain amino acid transport system ATP-binding protein